MAEQSTNQGAGRKDEGPLAGGTQGGDASRHIGKDSMAGGTPDTTAPSGGAFPEPPARAVPRTDVGPGTRASGSQPGHAPKEHTPNEKGPGGKKV
jgi:hypothetical protein